MTKHSKNSILTARGSSENAMLNGLRGMSVMMILFYHCFMLPVLLNFKDNPLLLHQYLEGLPNYLQFIFGFDKAVDIFFLLSAYLLCSQLLKEHHSTSAINLKEFYVRRFFRIIPIFAIALLLYSLLENDLYPKLIHNLLFIDNFYHDSIVRVGWSLSIEVQFYLILPFMVLFINKLKSYKGLLLGLLFMLSLMVRYQICLDHPELIDVRWIDILNDSDHVFDAMTAIYTPTHARFGPLVLGMIWAYLYQNKEIINRLKRLPLISVWFIFGMSIVGIILSLQFPAYHQDSWVYRNFGTGINIWWLTLHRNLFALSILCIALVLDLQMLPQKPGRYLSAFLGHTWWRIPARLSFPMYLFQFPLIFISSLLIFWTSDYQTIMRFGLKDIVLIFVVSTLLTVAVSMVLHRYVEVPMIRRGKGLSRGQEK